MSNSYGNLGQFDEEQAAAFKDEFGFDPSLLSAADMVIFPNTQHIDVEPEIRIEVESDTENTAQVVRYNRAKEALPVNMHSLLQTIFSYMTLALFFERDSFFFFYGDKFTRDATAFP